MRLTSTSEPVIPSEARNLAWALVFQLRPGVVALALLLALLAAPSARAEYVVLRSGERLHVTAYQLLGDKYRLQLQGGWVDVQSADVLKIEPEEVFTPVAPDPPATPSAPSAPPYRELVSAAASRYGVDAELISSVMEVESHFDAKAISPKNARGLMQLLPETAARLGVKNIFDPQENIEAGTRYLKELLQLYNNNLTLALAAYNAGPDKVQKYGNVPPYRETVSYVNQVKRKYQKSKSAAPAKPTTPATPKASAGTPPPGGSAPPSSPPASPAPKTQDP
jgi:soluble lytic murein transglycosylase-like protein